MRRSRTAAVAVLSALAMATAGCGGGGDKGGDDGATGPTGTTLTTTTTQAVRPNLSTTDLNRLLLQPADLPAGYQPGQESARMGARDCAKTPTDERSDLAATLEPFGLQGCVTNTLGKKGMVGDLAATNGAYLEATAFDDGDGASKALPVLRDGFVATLRPTGSGKLGAKEELPVSGLGDEALPGLRVPLMGPPGSKVLSFYLYAWRVRNVVITLAALDALDDFDEQGILRIAKTLTTRAAA